MSVHQPDVAALAARTERAGSRIAGALLAAALIRAAAELIAVARRPR